GSVTRNPNKVTYHYGEVVQLTAIPAANWYFSYWDGDVVSSANPTSITIDGDKTVAVTFIQSDITLAVTADGEGTVAVDPDWAHYPAGQQVTLTASPAPGWSFDSWSG